MSCTPPESLLKNTPQELTPGKNIVITYLTFNIYNGSEFGIDFEYGIFLI